MSQIDKQQNTNEADTPSNLLWEHLNVKHACLAKYF